MTDPTWASQIASAPFNGLLLHDQRMIVVGAASGIGRAAALLLAARGAAVTAADIDADGLESLVSEAAGAGLEIASSIVDIADLRSIGELMGPFDAEHPLHGLVNCVGITGRNGVPGHEITVTEFAQVLQINLIGAFALSQAAIVRMRPHGYGRILHVASIAGKEGNPGMVSYSASKAGLIGMVKSLAKDYAEQGITVNALAPAVIHTPLVDNMPEHQVALNISKIPMRRLGTLAEAAEAIAWAVSPAASFTTGFTFDLSGGRATY